MAPPSMANALGADNEREVAGNTRSWEQGVLSQKEKIEGLFDHETEAPDGGGG